MWREPTEDDIIATISVDELEAYKVSANWEEDPVKILTRRAAAVMRDALRTNGNVALSPNERELPESCISAAMDYVAYDVIKRIGGSVTDERKKAREDAVKFIERITRRWYTPESWQSSPVAASAGPAITVVRRSRHRLTPEKLEGL